MKKSLLILLCFSMSFHCFPQKENTPGIEWNKMHDSKIDVFKKYNDLKLGMFIHWGVYSQLGGIWRGAKVGPETHDSQAANGEWIMHSARIPRYEYREAARTFNPVGFNTDNWVRLAKEAGMRYIIVMAKYHDGLAMYHSNVSDYNICDLTLFKRDPIKEIYKACKKHDLKMGIYYSLIDWMDGGDGGCSQAEKENLLEDVTEANTWDPSPASYQEYIENKAKPQMKEIFSKFQGLIEIRYDYPRSMDLQQSFDFYKLAYEYQPKCLVNSGVGNDLGDLLTAWDNQIPNQINKYKVWETPGTLNGTWGYKSYDNDWKSTNEMLFRIVDTVSRGGNYLLNVGPDGEGIIPEASIRILKHIGAWMKVNGEAIYGTSAWVTGKEGPTNFDRKDSGFDFEFSAEDFWFTKKGNIVYVISLVAPVNGRVSIQSLFDCQNQIRNISLLGDKGYLKWDASANKVNIEMPGTNKSNRIGFVLKVEMRS